MKNPSSIFTTIIFALGCFGPCVAHAVVPPPDGGYPGGNTAEGQAALLSLTTGGFNTGVGFFALRSNTEGQFNTAVGAGALLANVGDPSTSDGIQNTAIGAGALLSNTTGEDNTATGAFALVSNGPGDANTATGAFALQHNTTGSFNIAMGLGPAPEQYNWLREYGRWYQRACLQHGRKLQHGDWRCNAPEQYHRRT